MALILIGLTAATVYLVSKEKEKTGGVASRNASSAGPQTERLTRDIRV